MFFGQGEIQKFIRDRRVLFVSHKDQGYIRNTQEIRLIRAVSQSVSVLSADAKLTWAKYFLSITDIFFRCLFFSRKKYDVLFLGYLPQFLLTLLPFARKKTVIIDFFISLYDTIVFDKRLISPRNPIAKFLLWVDKKAISYADHIIVDTKTHGRYFSEVLGADETKISVLYLEADTKIYYPRHVPKPEKWRDKYIVLYFGSILPLQGISVVLEAMRILQHESRLFFIFIGPAPEKLLRKYTHLPNIHFIHWLKQPELSDYIAMSDLCLAGHFHATIAKARRVIPGKAYIYQAMKKPMILGENPANHELFSSDDPGVHFVAMGDAPALARTIQDIFHSSLRSNIVSPLE